jgi:hypothetical protein
VKRYVDKRELEILARVGLAIREIKYRGPWWKMFRVYKDGQVYTVEPDRLEGVWEAIETYMKENWPSAWSAVKCYEGWGSLVFEVERRREDAAKLEKIVNGCAEAERDRLAAQLDDTRAALGNGSNETLWRPGETLGEAVTRLVAERDKLREALSSLVDKASSVVDSSVEMGQLRVSLVLCRALLEEVWEVP